MRIIAFITEGMAIREILDHLREPTSPPSSGAGAGSATLGVAERRVRRHTAKFTPRDTLEMGIEIPILRRQGGADRGEGHLGDDLMKVFKVNCCNIKRSTC